MPYTPFFTSITDEIDKLMIPFEHSKKDLGYGWRRTFKNDLRFDLIDYKRKDNVVLRIGRGARIVEHYPVLFGLFDEVSKVIAKFRVHSVATLHEKHLVGLFELIHSIEKGVIKLGGEKKKRI